MSDLSTGADSMLEYAANLVAKGDPEDGGLATGAALAALTYEVSRIAIALEKIAEQSR